MNSVNRYAEVMDDKVNGNDLTTYLSAYLRPLLTPELITLVTSLNPEE